MVVLLMKIMNVVESTATGTLSMVAASANEMSRKGHDVYVVYSVRPETPLNLNSYFDDAVLLIKCQMSINSFFKSIVSLRRLILTIKPDIIHLHSSIAGAIGRVTSLFFNKSSLFYSPHCISFMRKDIGLLKMIFFISIENMLSLKRCLYVACSRSEQLMIERKIPKAKIILIENSVDMSLISSEAKSCCNLEISKNIISVGGLRTQKNPQLFCDIARKLIPKGFKFYWIGDGDPSIKAVMEGLGITVTGWLSRHEIFEIYNSGGIYLSTAQWEGMPVTLIEAMLAHLPIVASNCAGNNDVIADKITGLLYENIDGACERLELLSRDRELYFKLSSQAYKEAIVRFNNDLFSKKIEALFNESIR